MGIDERLVELLVEAEELRHLGRTATAEELCPDRPDLWDALRDLLRDISRVDELLPVASPRNESTEIRSSRSSGPAYEADAVRPSIPGYQVLREVGRGGMGVVFEAIEGSLGRHVALKVMRHHGDSARFRREAKAAGRLHHTNIVPVFGVGEVTLNPVVYRLSRVPNAALPFHDR